LKPKNRRDAQVTAINYESCVVLLQNILKVVKSCQKFLNYVSVLNGRNPHFVIILSEHREKFPNIYLWRVSGSERVGNIKNDTVLQLQEKTVDVDIGSNINKKCVKTNWHSM
jgi:hypothetical protein